ncbi:MAG: DNA starvation/stationary phase protection protein [Hyphomicrobiales bacterium]|nr:DNA starvation/stationary phase protection protein [Hyphomicrobiales bacterium]
MAAAKPNLAKNLASDNVAQLMTPTDLPEKGVRAIVEHVNGLVASAYALYVKTKNFHWHMSGHNFRDYHLLLDEHGDQIFATIDPLAERVRKLGKPTLHSIGEIARLSSIKDNDKDYVSPYDMLVELMNDNKKVVKAMREAHEVCENHKDAGTASLLEVYIDEGERRIWFLFECARASRPEAR